MFYNKMKEEAQSFPTAWGVDRVSSSSKGAGGLGK
jgi:hypothetical protein